MDVIYVRGGSVPLLVSLTPLKSPLLFCFVLEIEVDGASISEQKAIGGSAEIFELVCSILLSLFPSFTLFGINMMASNTLPS